MYLGSGLVVLRAGGGGGGEEREEDAAWDEVSTRQSSRNGAKGRQVKPLEASKWECTAPAGRRAGIRGRDCWDLQADGLA